MAEAKLTDLPITRSYANVNEELLRSHFSEALANFHNIYLREKKSSKGAPPNPPNQENE